MNELSDERMDGMPREVGERGSGGTDSFFTADSPLGTVYVAVTRRGVRYLARRVASEEEFVRRYGETFGRLVVPVEEGDGMEELAGRVAAALAGEKVEVPVDLAGKTEFQRKVLEVVRGIPAGQVRPYGWVAREAGSPGASRAVGSVMAKNPVPLILPCHRVIRNDGSTGHYGSDPGQKMRLLKREGVPVEEVARAPYVAAVSTGVVCFATCGCARSAEPEDRREFRCVSGALDAGFWPCEVCRPAGAA